VVSDNSTAPSTESASTATPVTPVAADTHSGNSAATASVETPDTSSTTGNRANSEPGDETSSTSYNSSAATPDTASNSLPVRGRVGERIKDRVENNSDDNSSASSGGGGHTFAVVTNGDPALMIPAQQMIEDKLSEAGFQSVNSKRADIIVRVKADIIGNQDISFYGQNATLTTAYLSVKPFARSGRALGTGFREKIDYTPLNAEDKVQQALDEHMKRVVDNVSNK